MDVPVKQLLEASPHYFASEINHLRMSPIHCEMMDFISEDPSNRKLLLCMRGAGKSEICRSYVTWYALNHPNDRILIVSDTDSKAQTMLRAIKMNLESDTVKQHYGDVRGSPWTDHSLTFNDRTVIYPEGTISACGSESGQVTGKHYDLIFIDDLVSFMSCRSELQRQRTEEWLLTSLLPTLMSNGNIICAGTRYHQAEIYDTIINRLNYKTLIIPPIRDDKATCFLRPIEDEFNEAGEVIHEGLNSIKKNLGSIIYSLQYQNDVSLIAENNIIKQSWLKYYKDEPDDKKDVLISVDLAIGLKDENDYTAMGVWCRDSNGNIYLLKYINKRITFNDTILTVQKLISEFKPNMVLCEDVAYQKAMIQELKRVCSSTLIKGIPPLQDKRARLLNCSNLFENGLVHLKSTDTEVIDQILYFPARFDDLVDMTTQALNYYKDHSGTPGIVIW